MKTQSSSPTLMARWIGLMLALCGLLLPSRALAGNWFKLTQGAPNNINLMLLLPNGKVMAARDDDIGTQYNDWYQLSPDSSGHYVGGSWSNLNSMNYTRLFYASQVLPNGKVFVAGGEDGTGGSTAELYDILSGQWTTVNPPISLMNATNAIIPDAFLDAESVTLPGGQVLISGFADSDANDFKDLIFDPNTLAWSSALSKSGLQDEASWVKLADGSILSVDNSMGASADSTNSERYIPSSATWIPDADVPVILWGNLNPAAGGETGPAFLLPNGNAFFLGGNGRTAIYTPSPLGGTHKGTWVQGPDIPQGLVSADAPAVMMPNGKILCAVAEPPFVDSSDMPVFPSPISFFEFDYTDHTQSPQGSFTQVASPTGGTTENVPSFVCAMLMLPDGTVLFSHLGTDLYVYQPDAPTVARGKPVIQGITVSPDGSFLLIGTGLNGISEGAAYGDDLQMDSNYPLVRLTDANNNVIYARTFNWSSTGVQTGTNIVTTEFTVPAVGGSFSLQVVANGIASDPVNFAGPVWVDFNYSRASPQLGTFSNPYSTLAQGVAEVASGGNIYIKPGHSTETLSTAKAMTLNAVGGAATIGN